MSHSGDDTPRAQPAGAALDFDRLIEPVRLADGHFSIDVPDGWQQGRGAFGGLVVAYLARATEAALGDRSRPLRTVAAHIVGPLEPGPAEIAVEVLRAGSGVTTAAARIVQAGQVLAHAVCVHGKERATYAAPHSLPVPDMPPWRERAPLPAVAPLGPTFTQHLEYWPTGPLPYSGAPPDAVPETAGWVRLRRPGRARGAVTAVALIDAYWPGFLASARAPRAAATLAFSFESMADLDGLDPDAPLFHRARILGGRAGYAVEARELWGEDRRLVALNQQVLVVMK
jgi:acyl-CoA thioesterase